MDLFQVASSLAVGQTATVITQPGRQVKVTRTTEGYSVEWNGTVIDGIPCNREQARLGRYESY